MRRKYLEEGNVPSPVRRCGPEHCDQILDAIQINPITEPLQILKHRLESQNPKPHRRSREAGNAHIGTHINNEPICSSFTPEFLQDLLNRDRNIGLSKEFPFEHSDDVFVRLIRQGSQVGERVKEGISEALHEVGDHGGGLRAR